MDVSVANFSHTTLDSNLATLGDLKLSDMSVTGR